MKKQGTGFLIWAGFLGLMIIYPFLLDPIGLNEGITIGDFAGARLITSASIGMKLLSLLGGLISIFLCYLFYRFARVRNKRAWYAKLPGYLFCAIGTAYPYWGLSEVTRASFLESRGINDTLSNSALIISLVGTILFSALAYILIFKDQKRPKAIEQSENEGT